MLENFRTKKKKKWKKTLCKIKKIKKNQFTKKIYENVKNAYTKQKKYIKI